ncbi:MAG TPA: YceD family protein [Dermatophilaceae bacterium]|nr:YceD family protein [Dermatophilaceae bacterium]
MTRLDPRSPLVLDTKEVGRRPGSMTETTRRVGAPADLGTVVLRIEEGEPLDLDLRLESVVEGVLVTGSVRATATGACVRCLEPLTSPVDVGFQELFAYDDRAAHHRKVGDEDADVDEEYRVEDGLIGLETVLRDTVVPSLPFQPVCRPDCPGLCAECGQRLEDDPGHEHETIDPRWAALQGLTAVPSTTDEEKRT